MKFSLTLGFVLVCANLGASRAIATDEVVIRIDVSKSGVQSAFSTPRTSRLNN